MISKELLDKAAKGDDIRFIISLEENQFIENAKKLIELGMPGPALMSCRNALEVLIKELSRISGLQYDSREVDLAVMIDTLFEIDLIGEQVKDLLHRIRMICNKGAHAESVVTLFDAEEVVKDITDAYTMMADTVSRDIVEQANLVNNIPKPNPDYYASSRRYYGKWAHCFDRQSLLVIPEYVELERKSQEGDIEAMLDIAVGFLPKNIVWSSDLLVNMPPYIYKGREYNQDKVYDLRYYFWIICAVNEASYQLDRYPKKYIATAIWEGMKMCFYSFIALTDNYYVSGVEEWYSNKSGSYQYNPIYKDPVTLIKNMFTISDETVNNMYKWGLSINSIEVIREIFDDVEYCDFVAPIHEDAIRNPFLKIRFLRYCAFAFANSCYIENEDNKVKLNMFDEKEMNRDYALFGEIQGNQTEYTKVSEGDIFTWEMLIPYTLGAFCNEHYCMAKHNATQLLNTRRRFDVGAFTKGIKKIFK